MHVRDAARALINIKFRYLEGFSELVKRHLEDLDNRLWQEMEELERAREEEPEFESHYEQEEVRFLYRDNLNEERVALCIARQFMFRSLAVLMRSTVEAFLKRALGWGVRLSKTRFKGLTWDSIRKHFRHACCPLCRMPGYDKVNTLNQICNRIKHHDALATEELVELGYAGEGRKAQIELTGVHVEEFLSASHQFLKAVVEKAPYVSPENRT